MPATQRPQPDLLNPAVGRQLLRLTLALVALGRLLWLWVQPAPAACPALAVILALLLLGYYRLLPLRAWALLCLLAYAGAVHSEVLRSLREEAMPGGFSLWLPVVIVECFLLFGSFYGSFFLGLLGLTLLLWLSAWPPHGPALLLWLQSLLVFALLGALGYRISRFLEWSGQHSATTLAALNLARQDALTRVLGRAAAEQELERCCEAALAHRQALSLIVCDLDHFKWVNDRYGHARGDEVLRAVARKLRRSAAHGGAKVGRWGGEEFVVIAPHCAHNEAFTLAEQIRRDVSSAPLAGLDVTLSLGVATYRSGKRAGNLFQRADEALYRAKAGGRNRAEAY